MDRLPIGMALKQRLKQTLPAVTALLLALAFASVHAQDYNSGKEAYDKLCGYCHKPEVGVGTAIEGRQLPAVFIMAIARHGLNAMPAFPESHIDDETLEQIAEHINTLPLVPLQQAPGDEP